MTKLCYACRSEIELAATVCKHCRTETPYEFFVEIDGGAVRRKRTPVKDVFVAIVGIVSGLFGGLCGLALGGFWVAVVAAVVVGAVFAYGAASLIRAGGGDEATIVCLGCGQEQVWRWEAGTLTQRRVVTIACGCGARLATVVT
jgi:hypothetical protein